MNSFNEVYINNKRLDNIFYENYKNDSYIYEKNCLELLTELGEFANETKVFKYWSIKKPNNDAVLEEYADCITMALYFFNEFNLELNNLPNHIEELEPLKVFNYLFIESSKLMEQKDEKIIKNIFVNLLHLGKLLNFKEEDIIKAINNKHKIIEERLNSNY